MNTNSMEALQQLDTSERKAMILRTYRRVSKPLTDREVSGLLSFHDLNCVRPRITELLEAGIVQHIGSVKCPVTRRTVRACTLRGR
jgi:hypothetical protein